MSSQNDLSKNSHNINKFEDLVDIPVLSRMLSKLYDVAGIPSALIDMEGNILTWAGGERVCNDFYRKNPEAEKVCIQSDISIKEEISKGKPYAIYKCPHGLVDSCAPIIIEGNHIANVFTGQMLHTPLNDEAIEEHKILAEKYGFDEDDYLDAVREVRVFPIEKHKDILDVISLLASQIAQMGLNNLRILEQKKVVEESEKLYRNLFQNNHSIMLIIDPATGDIIDANPAACDFYGYNNEEMNNKNISDINHLPKDEILQEMTIANEEKRHHFYFKHHLATGEIKDVEVYSGPITRHGKELLFSIIHDITERRQAEKDKAKLESQLIQTQKMEAIGTLAGGIAHDFNNILTIILGNAEMALKYIPSENRSKYSIDQILTASNRAKNLVHQILSFSRQKESKNETLYLCQVIEDSIRSIRSIIPSTVDLKTNIPSKCKDDIALCHMIFADPIQIHQIVLNLCINSVQAMDENGVLEITLKEINIEDDKNKKGLKPGAYEYFSVSDNGSGISPEIINKIFDPFFTTKEVGKGTGMGLSVIHGIIKNLNGKIFVKSEPGSGTTFHIYFPVAEILPDKTVENIKPIPTGSEQILFVDDEKMLANLGRYIVESLGYSVITTTDSIKALSLFKNDPAKFDLVITDQTMPNMTGTELSKKLLQTKPDLPIIICTGYSSKLNKDIAKKIGVKAFVSKPYDKRGIAEIIREVLDTS